MEGDCAYLKRDVSTVKRWEKQEGLPVHRHEHRLRSGIYANPRELDAWRMNRQPAPPTPSWQAGRGRVLRSTAVALAALLPFGDTSPVGTGAPPAGLQARGVERRVLSQADLDTNSFLSLRPSPDGRRVAYGRARHG